jgi:hypothetical protein
MSNTGASQFQDPVPSDFPVATLVEFLPDTPQHREGFRLARCVSLDTTVEQHFTQEAARYGLSPDAILKDVPKTLRNECWPVFETLPTRELPISMRFACFPLAWVRVLDGSALN